MHLLTSAGACGLSHECCGASVAATREVYNKYLALIIRGVLIANSEKYEHVIIITETEPKK